jgi:tetratricopeptide (TPR) repeat protein
MKLISINRFGTEIPEPSEVTLANYIEAKKKYEANPKDVEALIWYGKTTAYLGQYQQAIGIFTEGITNFPQDARLYRNRGHRYISIREYDKAISDFEKAALMQKR